MTKVRIKAQKEPNPKKIREVRLVRTPEEANDLLSKGWDFVHAGAVHMDDMGYNAKPLFILAKNE